MKRTRMVKTKKRLMKRNESCESALCSRLLRGDTLGVILTRPAEVSLVVCYECTA